MVAAEGVDMAPFSHQRVMLQWGRGLVAAEGFAKNSQLRGLVLGRASMGPRLGGRGRSHRKGCMFRKGTLQWGRGLVAAEGPTARR